MDEEAKFKLPTQKQKEWDQIVDKCDVDRFISLWKKVQGGCPGLITNEEVVMLQYIA